MTPDGNSPQTSAKSPVWRAARLRMKQLENAAQKMSPKWFVGNAGVIVAALLFLITAIVLAGALQRILTHGAVVQKTQNALRDSGFLQESLDEASAAARGFVITHDPSLVAVREQAKHSIHANLANLAGYVKGDPVAERYFRDTANAVAARVKLFDTLIEASKTTPNQAGEQQRIRKVQLSNAQLSALRAHLRSVLQYHEARITFYLELAVVLVLVAGVAAPLSGLLGIYLLRRERDSQRARELQMELMHVQRLAIMGETSAMLAHEINQPLAAATNYISVLRRLLDIGAIEKAQPVVERISEQVQRTGTILRKLRRFIEKRESERTLESPEVLVDDAITLLGTIDNEVGLDTRIGADLPRVMVDRIQLQQVLVNLMRNAIEAMQDCPRRELVLSVISPDRHIVEVRLADTGPGLPQHVSERLFQPFVSTKQSGMGVGLSICRSIIEQHNGRIWAEPNPGGGTVFCFTLPAAEERAAA